MSAPERAMDGLAACPRSFTWPMMRGLAQPIFALKKQTKSGLMMFRRSDVSPLFLLSPWMRLIVDLGQMLEIEVGIDLCG